MSKELEALERGILEFEKELEYDCNNEWLKRVIAGMKKCYQRLEAIDNSNPSEALKFLESIELTLKENRFLNEGSYLIDNLNTIKQALQKSQELPEPFKTGVDIGVIKPKHYLKWEDLETTKTYKCLLNGNEYVVNYYSPQECDPYWRVRLMSPNRGVFIVLKENYDKQFFNDLPLKVIEVIDNE